MAINIGVFELSITFILGTILFTILQSVGNAFGKVYIEPALTNFKKRHEKKNYVEVL